MLLGYNTNGLAHHDLVEAIELLAEIGYRSVAITIDHAALAPGDERTGEQLRRVRGLLKGTGMRSVIETGARFLLDPRRKHQPTLVSSDPAGRARRIAFTRHAIRCAAELGSDCVSLWSGALDEKTAHGEAMARLVEGLRHVLDFAAAQGVAIGLEPEPDMLVDSMAGFEELLGPLKDERLGLTLDVGHLHCQGEEPIPEYVRRFAGRLVNVHLEDMRAGVHEHLRFGEGEIDFPSVLQALADVGYQGGVHVELSRHSHEGPAAARRAYEFLQPLIERTTTADG
jgi:sugar phosphate isomerase/epimerase